MNARGVAIQGGLAALVLVGAYATWQREPEMSTGEVFVLDLTKNDLEKVRFEDQEGKSWSELSKGKDAEGSFVYVRLSGYDSTGAALPSGHPGIALKLPERQVRGNENAERLLERFAPLRATRALGVLDGTKLKELGLETPKTFLEVSGRGVARRYAIVPAPPGGTDPYIKDLQDNKVYIVPRPLLSDMQSAQTNLVERRLHAFRIEEIERVSITGAGTKKELTASRIDEYPGIRLTPTETPGKPDETLKNWHDRIFNLFPTEVLGKDEVPPPAPPVVALRLEYRARGRNLGWVELARSGAPAASAVPGATTPHEVFARSEFTAGWIKLSTDAQNLLTEGEGLLTKK
jgi:hypothetical protein